MDHSHCHLCFNNFKVKIKNRKTFGEIFIPLPRPFEGLIKGKNGIGIASTPCILLYSAVPGYSALLFQDGGQQSVLLRHDKTMVTALPTVPTKRAQELTGDETRCWQKQPSTKRSFYKHPLN